MKNTINTIGTVAQCAGGLSLLASFFIKDNDKAVNMRYVGVGLVIGGTVARLTTIGMKESTAKK